MPFGDPVPEEVDDVESVGEAVDGLETQHLDPPPATLNRDGRAATRVMARPWSSPILLERRSLFQCMNGRAGVIVAGQGLPCRGQVRLKRRCPQVSGMPSDKPDLGHVLTVAGIAAR